MAKPLQDIMVLVADDAPLNLMITTQVLLEAGAKVITAINGKEVLERLEEHDAEIILMDLQMPELDGFETTQVIRYCGQRYGKIPIIAVTAEEDELVLRRTIDVGMNDFIIKPFKPQDIHNKILALLQKPGPAQATIPEKEKEAPLKDFDLTYLQEITNGETEKLLLIVNNLAENAPLLLQQSLIAVQSEKWLDAAAHIHKLKGLLSLFYMPKITEVLLFLEVELKNGLFNKNSILNRIDFINDNLKILIESIFNYLKN